jgi:hypothetical protein
VSVPSSTGGEVCMRTGWFVPVFIREKGLVGRWSGPIRGGGVVGVVGVKWVYRHGGEYISLLKMEPTQSSETSAFNTQTPGKYPEDNLSL